MVGQECLWCIIRMKYVSEWFCWHFYCSCQIWIPAGKIEVVFLINKHVKYLRKNLLLWVILNRGKKKADIIKELFDPAHYDPDTRPGEGLILSISILLIIFETHSHQWNQFWHKKFTLLLQMRTWVLLKSRSTSLWEISSTLTLWRWRLAFRSRSGLQSLWSPTVIDSYFWPSIFNIFILLGKRWDLQAGFILGGWILGFSQCLALRDRFCSRFD